MARNKRLITLEILLKIREVLLSDNEEAIKIILKAFVRAEKIIEAGRTVRRVRPCNTQSKLCQHVFTMHGNVVRCDKCFVQYPAHR